MTWQLDLVGASTVNLGSGGSNSIMEYVPRIAQLTPAQMERMFTGVRNLYDEPTVVESAKIRLTGTQAQIQTAFQTIQNILRVQAPQRQKRGAGTRVFVKWLAEGLSGANRAEVLHGSAEFSKLISLQFGFVKWYQTEIVVAWKRRLWEKDSETAVPLTNGNGSSTTAGLNVFNCNDGTGINPNKLNNYVEVLAADATGVLPAPLRLELSNTYGTALRRVYVAHMAAGTPGSFTHTLEWEDASLNATYCTAGLTSGVSNGSKVAVVNVPASAVTLATWTISAAQAGYCLSQWVRVLCRFSVLPSNSTINVRLTLKDATSAAILAQTDWQLLNNTDYLQPLPTLELSPNLQGQASAGAMTLLFDAKDSAATGDFTADFIQLSPIEAGSGFRLLKPIDETLAADVVPATTGVLTDNMIDGGLYSNDGATQYQGVYRSYGRPLMLLPGVLQRFYLLMDGASDAAIARKVSVKAWYRPRVETV